MGRREMQVKIGWNTMPSSGPHNKRKIAKELESTKKSKDGEGNWKAILDIHKPRASKTKK